MKKLIKFLGIIRTHLDGTCHCYCWMWMPCVFGWNHTVESLLNSLIFESRHRKMSFWVTRDWNFYLCFYDNYSESIIQNTVTWVIREKKKINEL
jgi:hypothetical protein